VGEKGGERGRKVGGEKRGERGEKYVLS